jgi:zeaxanthin glucosyltransferase
MFGSRPLLAPIQLKELSVPKVRSTIGKVLTQESYKQSPIALQDTIARSGGVKKAADIIEQALLTRKPVLAEK